MPGIRSSLYTIDRRHRGFSEQVVQYHRPGAGLGAAQTTRVQPVAQTSSLKLSAAFSMPVTTMPKIPLLGFGPRGDTTASDAGPEAVEEAVQSTTEVLEPGGGIYPMPMPSVSSDTVGTFIDRAESDAAQLETDLRATNPWVLAFAGIAGATLGFALLRLAR